MRLRRLLLTGAVGAAALLAIGTAADAAQNSTATTGSAATAHNVNASGSLRSLAARIGLRIGSAIVPQDIETPSYAAIASSQFSVVTPGNAMKWQVVEPTEGSYDWSKADQLVAFARANHQLIRGHTLLWHN
ncbi:MAG: endo-1,4-beta-xylanase, partial [Trebonia sp.]